MRFHSAPLAVLLASLTGAAAFAGEPMVLSEAQLDQVSAAGTYDFSGKNLSYSATVETASDDGTFSISTTQSFALSPGGEHTAETGGTSTSSSVATYGTATGEGGVQNRSYSGTTVVQTEEQDIRTTTSVGFASAGAGGSTSASSGGAADSSDEDIVVALSPPVTVAAFTDNDNDGISFASSSSSGSSEMRSVGFATSASAVVAIAAR